MCVLVLTEYKLIARDEALHLTGTQTILNLWANNKDDPEMEEICRVMKDQGRQVFLDVVEQEKEWAEYRELAAA